MQDATVFTEEQFRDRLSIFATEETIKRFMPKKTRKPSNGICPHCGEPCAPYTTCKEYRALQTIGRIAREEVKAGRLRVIGKEGNELIYEKTPEGEAYYASLHPPEHKRFQGSREKERRLKRMGHSTKEG